MASDRSVRGIVRRAWKALGPGLITGAADDDPSGIATYSQAGAQFGYALTWTVFLTLPFMAAIQIISGCIGWRTRHGLAHNIGMQLGQPLLYPLVALLIVANTINIAADLAAMGAALRLVIGGPALWYALAFAALSALVEVLTPYHRYAGYLKFLTLVLFVYVAAAFSISIPWAQVAAATFLPTLSLDSDFLLMVVAVFGTTISPYLFFWQASQEAEEARIGRMGDRNERDGPRGYFRRITIDTCAGTLVSHLVAYFIIVTTAATLHAHGITQIETAAQAAEALRPIAGDLTFALFAAGIIGTGLLAVPILAGSAAYAAADAFHLHGGSLELPASRAIGFYAIVSAATMGGAALAVTGIDPIKMLFWSAVINGVAAVPIMAATMVVISSPSGLKLFALPRWLRLLGWLATGLMSIAVGLLVWASIA